MEKALKQKEFIPYLQPKMLFFTEQTVGAEMLVRWLSSEKGMIQPDEFIPLFEKNGFILKLDLYMFRNTCALLREWNEKNITEIPRISVNMSKELELETVAEGVETKEQVDCLRKMGCDIAQGYYYARPMPIKEFEEKYIQC